MSRPTKATVALLQIASPPSEPRADRIERVLASVEALSGADVVVLPELWATGYFDFAAYGDDAEPLDGAFVARLREAARRGRTWLCAGSMIESAGGRLYNTTVVLSDAGDVTGAYRKIHLFSHESDEARLLHSGTSTVVVPTPWGRMTMSTCYDLRFPELYRVAVDAGAELALVTAAWPAARAEHWDVLTRARAIENQMYLVAVNGVGMGHGGTQLGGASRVVHPSGAVVAEAVPDVEQTVIVEIDTCEVREARAAFPALRDRQGARLVATGTRA